MLQGSSLSLGCDWSTVITPCSTWHECTSDLYKVTSVLSHVVAVLLHLRTMPWLHTHMHAPPCPSADCRYHKAPQALHAEPAQEARRRQLESGPSLPDAQWVAGQEARAVEARRRRIQQVRRRLCLCLCLWTIDLVHLPHQKADAHDLAKESLGSGLQPCMQLAHAGL